MGSLDGSIERIAAQRYLVFYEADGEKAPMYAGEFARMISLAKVWSVVEYLASNADNLGAEAATGLLKKLSEKCISIQ